MVPLLAQMDDLTKKIKGSVKSSAKRKIDMSLLKNEENLRTRKTDKSKQCSHFFSEKPMQDRVLE